MRYNMKNILSGTALALFIGLTAPAVVCAQALTPNDLPQLDINPRGQDAAGGVKEIDVNINVNEPIPLDNAAPASEAQPLSLQDNSFDPILPADDNAPILPPEGNAPILPADNNAPILPADNVHADPFPPAAHDPLLQPASNPVPARDPLLPHGNNNSLDNEIPDLINVDSTEDDSASGDDILNQIDSNLFSKMSSIEKQSALLSLELRREKIRNEIAAIKAQRKQAEEEELAREEERRMKKQEWENEQQRKLLVEQQKLEELKNQQEALRQEKIVKAYKETMLQEKQEWIKQTADIYNQMKQIEDERDAIINDFKMKLNNLKNIAAKNVASAQSAKERYTQAINSLKTQLSIVQSRLDAELSAKVAKNNPFATVPDESTIKLNDVYVIMEIAGKGENLAAKLMNKNGDRFLVRKGTILQTGHIIDEITETYIRADLDGVKDYLFFAAGGILDSEPQKSSVLKDAQAALGGVQAQGTAGGSAANVNTSAIPSLGEGMFVR